MLDDFLSLFFPRICVACDGSLIKGEKLICTTCEYKMTKADTLDYKNHFLARKFYGRVNLEDAFAYYVYNKQGRIQKVVHKMKYHNMPEIGFMAGEKLGNLLVQSCCSEVDIIIPIPLHPSKLRRRGYNQSEHFANGLASRLEKPVMTDSVKRLAKTSSQTRKSRMARWRNVEHIFEVQDKSKLQGQRVLLVDDVVTTGATMESCAEIIQRAGCKSISIAAMAAAK